MAQNPNNSPSQDQENQENQENQEEFSTPWTPLGFGQSNQARSSLQAQENPLTPSHPSNIEAERALLGCLMLDSAVFEKLPENFSAKAFFERANHDIFHAITLSLSKGQATDPVSVLAELISTGVLKNTEHERSDALRYMTTLVTNTVSSASATRYAEIVLEQHFFREILSVGNELCTMARNPNGLGPYDVLALAEGRLFSLAQGANRISGLSHVNQSLKLVIEEIETEQERIARGEPDTISGFSTGFKELDSLTQGLQPGDLVILAGRPSMGKTSLGLNISEHIVLEEKLPVAIFSMEMSSKLLAKRLISSLSRIEYNRIIKTPVNQDHEPLDPRGSNPFIMQRGGLVDHEWAQVTQAIERLSASEIHIDETPALTANDIRSRCRKLARSTGQLGLVLIDYLQLMSPPPGFKNSANKTNEIAETTRALKGLAKELNCPVVALSQLNRSLESRPNKRPIMSDLRESGAIEQDADLIVFIYRDEVYNKDSMDLGSAELIIGKQRNGPIGTVKVNYLSHCTRFEDSL